jgi:diguanylate cyclase (GGDEF)-like protein
VDYITKPIRAPIVKARVDTHVRLKRYRDKLERMSWIDGLTGLANRRRFDEALAREWERTRRDEAPLSVILMDVDHFKGFNDNYGHQAGDDCLQEVARALADTVSRPADLVARYGGEEFVCLLPGTDCAGAEQLAEGIRAAVADLGIRHEHSSAADHVTLSLGVACTVPDGERRPQELSQQADENLYTAKESGRNRVYGSPAGR